MRMMSIASGSSGNCIYIGSDSTHILIDDGISKKRVVEGLRLLDLSLKDIDAILITHEHDDHISGLGVLERDTTIPIYGTMKTVREILRSSKLGNLPDYIGNGFEAGESFAIGDLIVSSIPVSHDALDPVGYKVSCKGHSAGVVTDLGCYTEETVSFYQGLDVALVEANHDVNMLLTGRYPYTLKQRVLGEKGHLSNEAGGQLIGNLLNDKMRKIFLGHLSHENNFPELAYETVRNEINLGDNPFHAKDFDISVAGRDCPSEIIQF